MATLTDIMHSSSSSLNPITLEVVRSSSNVLCPSVVHVLGQEYKHTSGKSGPPKPLAGLTSGDWREQEWKSLWEVQPLQDWMGEVSERT